jgi:hypothetical protein
MFEIFSKGFPHLFPLRSCAVVEKVMVRTAQRQHVLLDAKTAF